MEPSCSSRTKTRLDGKGVQKTTMKMPGPWEPEPKTKLWGSSVLRKLPKPEPKTVRCCIFLKVQGLGIFYGPMQSELWHWSLKEFSVLLLLSFAEIIIQTGRKFRGCQKCGRLTYKGRYEPRGQQTAFSPLKAKHQDAKINYSFYDPAKLTLAINRIRFTIVSDTFIRGIHAEVSAFLQNKKLLQVLQRLVSIPQERQEGREQ